jgi:hypothetical protein
MSKYRIGLVNAIDLADHHLYVLLPDKLLIYRFDDNDWNGRVLTYNLPLNKFTLLKLGKTYLCLYST